MTFAHPHAFWLLAALPLLFALFLHRERQAARLLGELVAPRLQPVLAGNASRGARRLRFALLLLGLAAIVVALAQPRVGFRTVEHKAVGRDVLIAIDTSRSMLANDLSPTRLARAKLAAVDLIGKLQGDRVGIIAFAGSAFLQAPLTADYAEVISTLRETDTNMIPVGGTNLAEAIRVALEAFGKGESEHRALIIFTDGEELDADGVSAAKKAAETMKIFTIGCGTPEGTLITVPGAGGSTEYVKGPDGQIVKSRLDEKRLRDIAESTGGFYILLQNGPPEMQHLVQDGLEPLARQEAGAQSRREPIERYQWPLAAAILLLAASMLPGDRRKPARVAGALAALFVLLGATPAEAKNTGLEAYDRQDYRAAQKAFEEQLRRRPESAPLQFGLGAAAYKSGDLEKALDAFGKAVTTPDPELRAKAEYNLGNTLFQRGMAQKDTAPKMQDWKNSLQHYEEALKVAPKAADAEYNRDVVKALLAKLEQEQQQKQEQKEKDKEKEKQEKKDQQEQKDQQGDKKDKQDQKDQKEGEQQKSDDKKDGDQQEKDDGKDGKKDEQKDGNKSDEQKPDGSEGGDEKKPSDKKEGKDGKDPADLPKPGEGDQKEEKEAKKTGDISDADPKTAERLREEQAQAEREAQEAKEEELAALEGKLTPAQAEALFDSVKSSDRRVRLWNPSGPAKPRANLRDW
jgi:Ca-activated chloride channel family protein